MRRAAWLFVALSTGCVHSHFQRDAPGHVDLSKPPTNPESRTVESPRDPGEKMIVTSVGPFAGLGVESGSGDTSFASTLGFALLLAYIPIMRLLHRKPAAQDRQDQLTKFDTRQ